MTLFIVGLDLGEERWDLCAAFDHEQGAINACSTPQHFYVEVPLNERLEDRVYQPWKIIHPVVA